MNSTGFDQHLGFCEQHIKGSYHKKGLPLQQFSAHIGDYGPRSPRKAGAFISTVQTNVYDRYWGKIENGICRSIHNLYSDKKNVKKKAFRSVAEYLILVLSRQPNSFFDQLSRETRPYVAKMRDMFGLITSAKLENYNLNDDELRHFEVFRDLSEKYAKAKFGVYVSKKPLIFSDSPVIWSPHTCQIIAPITRNQVFTITPLQFGEDISFLKGSISDQDSELINKEQARHCYDAIYATERQDLEPYVPYIREATKLCLSQSLLQYHKIA